MSVESADRELVGLYARDGSETAFQTLVSRHVDLVFGAAFRQTGNPGLAEEITQDVFIALARKAPWLAAHETLAGWLHRTAILEAKARLRSELRRQRREHVAAALEERRREGRNPVEDLAPLLDEGLLRLRDADRLVLILRFLEERSLREVGEALGIAEDSARKRVDRALERLAAYFRVQGFAIPAGAAAALTQASTASAAPAGLAMAAAKAGLAAAGPGGLAALLGLSALQLANLQTAGLCALLVAMPLGWRWTQQHQWEAAARALAQRQSVLETQLNEETSDTRQLRERIAQAEAGAFNLEQRLAQVAAATPGAADRYRWDDGSPLARIPKELLKQFWTPAISDRQGTLTPEIRALLQMAPGEAEAVQESLRKFSEAATEAHAARMKPVRPSEEELEGRPASEVRVFEIQGDFGRVLASLTGNLIQEVSAILGPERTELFRGPLGDWIPLGDQANGLSSTWAFTPMDHRIRFLNETGEADGELWIQSRTQVSHGSVGGSVRIRDIPPHLRAHLADWISDATDASRRSSERGTGRPTSNPQP